MALSCGALHAEDDPCIGEPLCPQCFNYERAVLFNYSVSELWRRTVVYLPRRLARLVGMTQKQVGDLVRVSYVRVAEYQRRGVVHLHVVIRLDQAMPAPRRDEIRPPDGRFTAQMLSDAVREAAETVSLPVPVALGGGQVTWGRQIDVQTVGEDGMRPTRCASYLAKYSTKATEVAGGVSYRVKLADVANLRVREHVKRLIRAAYIVQSKLDGNCRVAQNAHNFGYCGHCLTKSRNYSTTFQRLRGDRARHVREALLANPDLPESQRRLLEVDPEARVTSFVFFDRGHLTPAEWYLNDLLAAGAEEERQAARAELLASG
jgi:hypothetical protein